MAGASPETMASSVATPLEQSLGAIAGVSDMSSRSTEGSTRISLMFDLDKDINGAARDVQAAINAARSMLPSSLRNNPTYRKVNPASAPVMVLALTSKTSTQGRCTIWRRRCWGRKWRKCRGWARWKSAAVRCRPSA